MKKDKTECTGCGACIELCGEQAVTMAEDEEGFSYPVIDQTLCIHCGKCDHSCDPAVIPAEKASSGIAFRNSDDSVRSRSSSGGAFGAITEAFWSQHPQGIVFGAAFDQELRVIHIGVSRNDGIEPLHGSKYVQSDMGTIYHKIRELLSAGTPVLFSGTPCQCSGIRNLFGEEKNLLIVDTICHGVASPTAFRHYLETLSQQENNTNNAVTAYNFRNKKYEKGRGMSCTFSDGTILENPHGKDRFCRMYMKNMISRPSCYRCSFPSPDRSSDLTVGDFHGLELIDPEFYQDGTSLVIPHTEKGKNYLNQIRINGESKEYPIGLCMQPRLEEPATSHILRKIILKDYIRLPEEVFEKKYGRIV